MTKIQKRL